METITSKDGKVYQNYNQVDDETEIDLNSLYFIKRLSWKTYNVGEPVQEIFVSYYNYYVYDVVKDIETRQLISVDKTYNIKNKTTDETLKNQTKEQLNEYLNNFKKETTNNTTNNNLTTNTTNNVSDEYINETGHTEDAEELVDGAVSLFDESNIITEETFGVTFIDDEYHQGQEVDVNSIVKDLQATSDLTTLMGSSVATCEDDANIVTITEEQLDVSTGERTTKNTFEAAVGIVQSVNEFGQFLKKGGTCPVCGKHIDFMPGNGYCSIECAVKDLKNKILSTLTGEYETETPQIIEKVKNVLSYFNLTLNVVTKIPDLLASIAKLPQEYKDYATAKINLVFLEIKRIINLLLIKKNELIIKLLRRIKFGTIDDKLAPLFAVIAQVIKAVNAAKQALETSLAAAYNAIKSASGQFYIGPQEYGFFWTLKSNMAICPYFKTDATVYPAGQLGRPFWGGGTMNIAFDMSLCQISLNIGAKSALQNVDFQKVNKIIRDVFLPIQTVEYLMDPDLFDVRLALSDQNAPAIEKIIKILEKTIVIGGDFIPTYENLSLINVWYVIAILTCWGPWTRAIFGDFIFHGAL